MEHGQTIEQNTVKVLENLVNEETARFFGLTKSEIANLINSIEFSRGGISPMFLSPGYDGNNTNRPQIVMTLLSNRPDAYPHEVRHGLHYKTCCVIFERPETCLDAFRLFCDNVLGDERFIKLITTRGSEKQRDFIRKARDLQKNVNLLPQDISNLAVELGALTYQHAYFVDPRMCEAVASYGDTGITKVVGSINRIVTSFIPYHNTLALKGYGDKKSQSMFAKAELFQKTLLVKKDDYKRERFFSSRQ